MGLEKYDVNQIEAWDLPIYHAKAGAGAHCHLLYGVLLCAACYRLRLLGHEMSALRVQILVESPIRTSMASSGFTEN